MVENLSNRLPLINLSGSDDCGLEGVATPVKNRLGETILVERPKDCPNNPWRYPGNHRPRLCQQCPSDPEIWKVAKNSLPSAYIAIKNGRVPPSQPNQTPTALEEP